MGDPRPTENDAASDVDEVAGRDEITDGFEQEGHGLPRKDVAREKYARENGEKGELHGLSLRVGFAGNENAERQGDENIGQGKNCEEPNAAMNRHAENKTNARQDQAKLEETDCKIGE